MRSVSILTMFPRSFPTRVTVAIVSFIGFIVAGFAQNVYITWLASAALLLGVLLFLRARERKQAE